MPRENSFREELAKTRAERPKKRRPHRTHHCVWGVLKTGIILAYSCSEKATVKRLRLVAKPPAAEDWRVFYVLMEGDLEVKRSSKKIGPSLGMFDLDLLPHQTLIIKVAVEGLTASTIPYTLDYFVDID